MISSATRLPSYEELKRSVLNDVLLADPCLWVDATTHEFLWSKQREILNSVAQNRRTAVRTCHGCGKSYVAARAAVWWLDTHPVGSAFVLTTAPTAAQIKVILWKEIGQTIDSSGLQGRRNMTEFFMPTGSKEILVAMGRKPADLNPAAFQGIHYKYVLLIIDEAGGVARVPWDAASTLITNDFSKVLVIGNPDYPFTKFYEVCSPGSGWNVIKISAFDTPNFTGEPVPDILRDSLIGEVWVEEAARDWGEDSSLYTSKVLAEFPENATQGLVSRENIKLAMDCSIDPDADSSVLGVDIGAGGDQSVICYRRGGHCRIIHRDTNPDTMQTAGLIIRKAKENSVRNVVIDRQGVGAGVYDRLIEQEDSHNLTVVGVMNGEKPFGEHYNICENMRARNLWALRTMFRNNAIDIDPRDDILLDQLSRTEYKTNSRGKIQIRSKSEMGKSPDRLDALALTMTPILKATW